jgi:GMP synthase (glutamine-hydrolysing)
VSKHLEQLRVRLVQVRERPAVMAEEQASFALRCGLRPHQFVITDALREPIGPQLARDVDAVMIGGAGAYSVTDTFAWTNGLAGLCHACAEDRVPLFGSCWGHQFIARAFGGEVVHDEARAELGTLAVSLTEAGQADELLSHFPQRFFAQMGHHDRVKRLPPGAVELATNATAPFQAFRLDGLPIYGTQFHSELNVAGMRSRLLTYRAYYPELSDDGAFSRVFDTLRETPEVDDLLKNFLLTYSI